MPHKLPFRFDGHGVNDNDGQRITKVCNCEPYTYPQGKPVRNAEFDYLSELFAAAPQLLASLLSPGITPSLTKEESALVLRLKDLADKAGAGE